MGSEGEGFNGSTLRSPTSEPSSLSNLLPFLPLVCRLGQHRFFTLTPHIVQSPGQLTAMAGHETGQATAITNSVSELELNRFLERVPVKKN